MPYPPEHAKRTRTRIVKSAQLLLQRHGFDEVSVRDIMAAAGLTHGSFYRYFRSKGDLYAEVVSLAFDFASAKGPGVVRAYLSRRHLENIGRQCPLIAVPTDVSRSDPAVKHAFEGVFVAMARCFERDLQGRNRARKALAIAGMCVGAMTVSRALADPRLSAQLREATLISALRMGGWLDDEVSERRRHARADAQTARRRKASSGRRSAQGSPRP
jgi:TetR/AcrR family transcriptional regulator, transcriptional repressor for nem operon